MNKYYLTGDEWVYILNELFFDAIPTCLLYDKNGKKIEKVTGYQGNGRIGYYKIIV